MQIGQDEVLGENTPCYQHIPCTDRMFPGYYSWWGLAIDQDNPPNIVNRPWILSGYLRNPPESFYGTNAFVSTFHNLLESYANSRGCAPGDICLSMGGTLRYWREIAYVVIVCTVNDEALNNYNPIGVEHHNVFRRIIDL